MKVVLAFLAPAHVKKTSSRHRCLVLPLLLTSDRRCLLGLALSCQRLPLSITRHVIKYGMSRVCDQSDMEHACVLHVMLHASHLMLRGRVDGFGVARNCG